MSRDARGLALLLATVLLLAPVVPFAAVGGAAAAPAGMSTIPDANVAEDVPAGETIPLSASELEGGVMASQHADSLDVTLTTADHASDVMDADSAVVSGDGMAVVLRDDVNSAGREVALDAGLLQQALGYRPNAIYGTHENGEQWTATAEYVDGYLVFDVPHFSSNTVTFSGEVTIDAAGATSGTQFEYGISQDANVSDASLILTGRTNTEWNNVSATDAQNGDTISVNLGGTAPPSGPSNGEPTITITPGGGIEWAAVNSDSKLAYGTSDGETVNTSHYAERIGGVGDYTGDGTTEIIFVTSTDTLFYYNVDTTTTTEISTPTIDGISPTLVDFDHDTRPEIVYRTSYDIVHLDHSGEEKTLFPEADYIGPIFDWDSDGENELVFADHGDIGYLHTIEADGTDNKIAEVQPSNLKNGGYGDVDDDGSIELTYKGSNEWYTIERDGSTGSGFAYQNQNAVPKDTDGDNIAEIVISGGEEVYDVVDGETRSYRDSPPYGEGIYRPPSTEDPGIDIDGDGSNEVAHSGTLSGSQTYTVDSLSLSDESWSVSASSGSVVVTAELKERTQTTAPSVELNSSDGTQTIDYTGTLAGGEAVDLSDEIDESLIGGATTVTATVDDPASGPAGQVDLNYSHSAQDQISTEYEASTFEESYNISHTYADATQNAQVTIPFASSRVVGVNNVEYRVDGGTWSRVAPANYRLNGTTLDVYLDDATGGVKAGQTVDVRATGRKISVDNGQVTVTDPTAPGEELDTELRIDSRQPDFAVNVGPTDDGDRVHYAYSPYFPTEDYVVIQSNGDQDLYLPNAVTADRVRVRHLDTRVGAERGDVRIDVVEAGENPELDVSPGPGGAGDPVTVEYYNTETGVKYLLNSLTRSIVVDSDVAESPAIFEDDDSEDTWAILTDSGPSGTSSSSGAVGQFTERASGAVGSVSLPVDGSGLGQLALVGVLGLGGLLVLRRVNPFGGSSDSDSAAVTSSTSTGSASGSAVSRLTGLASTAGAVGSRAAQTTGSGLLAALRRLLAYFGEVATVILGNRRASITAGVVAAIVAARVGLVSLPEGTGILIVVAGVPVATWLILRQNNAASTRVWLGSTIAAVILGLEFVAPGTVQTAIEQLTSETVAPLLILVAAGGVYLWYRARQSDRPQIIIGGGSE